MNRPIESDYTSQVAYTRALETYCNSLTQPAQQEPVPCCGKYESCTQACTPRGRFLGKREALAEQPAQQHGLEMVDDEGENQAVRMLLALYGGACGVTAEKMRKHLKMAGFDNAWPIWATADGYLTRAGAQLWIRHLFNLERPAQQQEQEPGFYGRAAARLSKRVKELEAQQQKPVAWNVIDPFGKIVATEKDAIRGWARIQGYKPTVESLLGFQEQGWRVVPASPSAQRKPLTDEQIRAVIAKIDPNEHYLPNSLRQLARAIEAAHGIKGEA